MELILFSPTFIDNVFNVQNFLISPVDEKSNCPRPQWENYEKNYQLVSFHKGVLIVRKPIAATIVGSL